METTAKVRFESDQDFIDGTISMGEMLDKWKSTADKGTTREYELKPNSSEKMLEVFLKAF